MSQITLVIRQVPQSEQFFRWQATAHGQQLRHCVLHVMKGYRQKGDVLLQAEFTLANAALDNRRTQ